jgi:hypothetical protein
MYRFLRNNRALSVLSEEIKYQSAGKQTYQEYILLFLKNSQLAQRRVVVFPNQHPCHLLITTTQQTAR